MTGGHEAATKRAERLRATGAKPVPSGWEERAACKIACDKGEAFFDDWFPEGGSKGNHQLRWPSVRRALAICDTCEVQSECLDDFLRSFGSGSRYGIRGGRLFGTGKSEGRRQGRVA